jgi:uncharacterized protein (UPF0218 family)
MTEPTIERGVLLPAFITLELPQDMRDELKRPLGPVINEDQLEGFLESAGMVATVGDMTTATVHRFGFRPQMAVVDYQTKRSYDPWWKEATASVGDVTVFVRNPPATITSDLYNVVLKAWTSRSTTKLIVEGEEDMASLPAILHAPEGATVIYGIPDTGLCLVQVDEGARDVVCDVLRRLRPRAGRVTPQEGD